MSLSRNILETGTEQNQNIVIKGLTISNIKELTKGKDPEVKKIAFILISWILFREEMIKFQNLQIKIKSIKDKKSEDLDEIEVYEIMSEIN